MFAIPAPAPTAPVPTAPAPTARVMTESSAPGSNGRRSPAEISAYIRRLKANREADIPRCLRVAGIDPETELRGVDLSGLDLHGLDLSGADLRQTNLHWADLAETRLTGARLDSANLVQTRLEGAILDQATFRGANLRGANLRRASLAGTCFEQAWLGDCLLLGARLDGTRFDQDCAVLAGLIGRDDLLLGPWTEAEGTEPPPSARTREETPSTKPGSGSDSDSGPTPAGSDAAQDLDDWSPLARQLLLDSLEQALLQAILYRNCGIDPAFYASADQPGLYASLVSPYLTTTVEQVAKALEPARKERLLSRRQHSRAARNDAAADDDLHLGTLNLLAREYEEAEQHLYAAYEHFKRTRRDDRLAATHGLLGCLALEQIHHLPAVRHVRRAFDMHLEQGRQAPMALFALSLSILAIQHNQLERAQQFADKAATFEPTRNPHLFTLRRDAVAGALTLRQGDKIATLSHWQNAAEAVTAREDGQILAKMILLLQKQKM